ncbi:MAG: SBBP repeat-containing protein [Acidobacteriota bacterium]
MRLAVIMTWVATCAMGATLQRPQVPYTFEENRGQAPEPVKFLARGQGYSLFLTEREAVLSLKRDARTQQVIRMSLDGARSPQSIAGSSPTGQTSNYFVGQREQWKTGVLHFESVRYSQVYPGVDMIYHSAANQLEYDFAVDAGASPNAIQLNFSGVEDLRVTPAGALELRFGNRKLVHQAPFAYQEIDGKRRRVAVAYQLRGDHSAGFRVGKYDLSRQLVIDPVVLYSTYLGGDRSDTVNAIAVDSAGNTYVTGQTTSTNFPKVGAGIFNPTSAVFYSFITKYNAAGTAILYSTYMGGSSNTTGYAIAADKDGNAFLAGVTALAIFRW